MQRFVALLLSLGLTGCGMELGSQLEARPQAMMFDKFDTTLVESGDHEWTIAITARSLLGKTFYNNNITVINGKHAFASLIKLTRDGGLYVTDFGKRHYRIGTYNPKATRFVHDSPVAIRLLPGMRFDIVWGDYIPMGGNAIELEVTGPLTAAPVRPAFLRP